MADMTLTLFQVTPPAATLADVLDAMKAVYAVQSEQEELNAFLFGSTEEHAELFAA